MYRLVSIESTKTNISPLNAWFIHYGFNLSKTINLFNPFWHFSNILLLFYSRFVSLIGPVYGSEYFLKGASLWADGKSKVLIRSEIPRWTELSIHRIAVELICAFHICWSTWLGLPSICFSPLHPHSIPLRVSRKSCSSWAIAHIISSFLVIIYLL